MQAKDFQPEDLFAQIQGLVDRLEAERGARVAAEAADAAKANLLGIVGQELRPPMEAVAALGDKLLASPLNPAQRRDAEALTQSVRRLLGALGEVVDFVTLEMGEPELAVERFDLHALVKNAASVLQQRASAKGLTSGVDMAANCPRFIVGDEVRVRQVLMGLVEAALQYTSEGSVRLYVSVNDTQCPLTVRFDVTDTGAGFSASEQENLFKPSTDTLRAGGRLGLPVAARLAQVMGGALGCDSALGQGTLYWFTFKAVAADDAAEAEAETPAVAIDKPAAAAGPKQHKTPGRLSGHLLVVEDNTVNRMLIGAYLDEFGLTYEMIDSGAAALMCLTARPYDLVLMDTVLPDYDGVQLAKRVRALHMPAAEVPIVALAARGTQDDGQELVAAGVNARVAKPIQGRALYAALVPFLATKDDNVIPIAIAS